MKFQRRNMFFKGNSLDAYFKIKNIFYILKCILHDVFFKMGLINWDNFYFLLNKFSFLGGWRIENGELRTDVESPVHLNNLLIQ